MSATTLKHRIGCYLFKTCLVPMRDKQGQVIRYKDGKPRMRHIKNYLEFEECYEPLINQWKRATIQKLS